ncbi:aa3-type cytochrome c oxidase subunit IV [Nitratireductor sp. XY-223]|uniref:aa3-type cytochrome c oxidase subunit IV n=1 Tax=Nitratireductor sp. XY-223 TaxID=2561926 RepID=UPI0010AA751C|nr:aa3-type cytochrome c oxidase subunit IV [Nitratireductor sp. XY-223]
MAEQNTGPVETGADMDYSEHEKTYSMFLMLAKFGTLICAIILIAMAIGFFTAAGFITATLVAVILFVAGFYLLR